MFTGSTARGEGRGDELIGRGARLAAFAELRGQLDASCRRVPSRNLIFEEDACQSDEAIR